MRNVARVLAAGTTSLLLLALAPAVTAHAATVTDTTPDSGAKLTSMPAAVVVTFDGPVVDGGVEVTAPAGSTGFSCPATTAGADQVACAPTMSAGSFPHGVYTVTYDATVLGAPPGVVEGTFTFAYDNTTPTITGLAIAPNPYTAANLPSPIVVSGTTEPGASVTVTLTSTGGSNPVPSTVTADGTTGAFSAPFSAGIGDGTLTASAVAKDTVNTSTTAQTTGIKDTIAPSFVSSAPADGASQKSTTGGIPNGITITASETLGSGSTITLSKSGLAVASTKTVSANTLKATPTDALPEGTYTATYTLVDAYGNASAAGTRTFVIDDTAPATPSYSPGPAVINIANKAAYTVTGTGEPGATVTLTITRAAETAVVGTATVAGNGTWSVTTDVSGLTDGAVALSATQADGAGNTSGAAAAGTTKDTVAPRVKNTAFDKAAYKFTGGAIPAVITGDVDDGTTTAGEAGDAVLVTVKDSGTGVVTAAGVTDGDGHFSVSVNVAGLADGTLTAEAVATDAASNSSTKGTATALKDTGLPAMPTVTMTDPINAAGQTNVTVSGVAEPGSSVAISINDTDAGTTPVTATTTAHPSTGAYTASGINVTSLSDGTLTATVVASDASGNASNPSTDTAKLDTAGPAAPDITAPAYVNAANKAAVPFSGTAEPSSTIALVVSDGAGGAADVLGSATTNGSGNWSATLDLSSLAEGALTVTATPTDTVGNPGLSASEAMTKDTVAPGSPVVSTTPTKLDYAHRTDDLVVSGTVTGGDLTADITVTDGDGGGADLVELDVPVTSNAFTHTFDNADLLTLADTTLTVRVTISDAAGNSGVSTLTQVVKDVTKLAIVSTSPAAGSSAQSVSTVSVTLNEVLVTGTDPGAPPYSAITVKKGGVTLAGSQTFTNANKTMTFTPSGTLTEGVYDVFVHATDLNDTNDVVDPGATPTFSFTVDATAPNAPTVSTVTDPVNSINQTAVTVSGTSSEVGLTVTVTITGTSGSVSKSALSTTGGAFTVTGIDVSALPDGTLTAVAQATDAAGNAGPSSAGLTATKETVLPTVSGLAATASKYSAFTTTVTGLVSEPGTVQISATDGTNTVTGPATVAGNGSFTGTLSLVGLATGPITVKARGTDAVGNIGPFATTTTTHDAAVPPSAPIKPSAVPLDRSVRVSFAAPANGGAPITAYTVVASPGGRTATGTKSPIVVTGLKNGIDYTFKVRATNRAGTGALSPASDAVMPLGKSTVTFNSIPSRVTYGTYVTLSGTLKRSDTSAPVDEVGILVQYDSGKFSFLASVIPSSTGAWSYRVRPGYNWTYFVLYGGDAVNDESNIVARRMLVGSRVTASAPTGSRTVNQVITGSVAPNKAGKTVYLYRITSTGAKVQIAKATLSSSSTYRFSVRLPAGSTRLMVYIPATTNNASGWKTFTATRS